MNQISSPKGEGAKYVKVLRDANIGTIGVQTATASYVDLAGSLVDAATASSISYTFLNSHATLTTKYTVYGSNDGVTFVVVQAEATVAAAGGTAFYTRQNPEYRYYKAAIIDGSGHGTLSGSVVTKD